VNLDQPGQQSSGLAAGQMLVDFLLDESLADVIQVSLAEDETTARQAVDERRAGVAVIIPADFTTAAVTPNRSTSVTLYHDPTLTIGPGIVKDLVSHYMDAFSGAKIAGQVAAGPESGPDARAQVIQKYTAWLQSNGHGAGEASPRLSVRSPAGTAQSAAPGASMFGPIMAGMVVFFVFFIGANGAESIIQEDEQGTLARLFTTPTGIASILGGKIAGVVLSLCIQVAILLLASSLLFGIRWGRPATLLLVSLALIAAASGFGLLLMSFVKNSRQTGPVLGGVMTLTGMLGGLFTTSLPNLPAAAETVTLFTPQGWALRGFKLALSGAGPAQAILPALVLFALGAAFFAVGVTLFRRRFA
jgi:ABC-2 type transport system permease protein